MKKSYQAPIIALLLIMAGLSQNPAHGQCFGDDPSDPVGIVPTEGSGDPGLCPGGARIEPAASGAFALDAFGNMVTIEIDTLACGEVFTWTVPPNIIIEKVIVGSADGYNEYDYTGLFPHAYTDGELHAPLDVNDLYAALTFIDFCFHYGLTVSKTAEASFTSTYDWTIDKICAGPDTLFLLPGETFDYPFVLDIGVTSQDSGYQATGEILIVNNTPYDAEIFDIADLVTPGDFIGVYDCGLSLPFVLPSGDSLTCTYYVDLPDDEPRTNNVSVTTTSPQVEGGFATAAIEFSGATAVADECVGVWEDCMPGGPMATICYDPDTLEFTCPISYADCGTYEYTNEAHIVTNLTETHDWDYCSFVVVVSCDTIPPPDGEDCTRSHGYWKTHSEFGPAPYDDGWAALPDGASTEFFLSGQNYHEAIWTAPQGGNAYYILAKQYIAAELNQLNGASIPPDVLDAFNEATDLFSTYTPEEIKELKGNDPLRKKFINLAGILAGYNEGDTGPGPCSDDDDDGNLSDNEDDGIQAIASPNPFDDEVQIEVSLDYDSEITLEVFNSGGLKTGPTYSAYLEAGQKRTFTFDLDDLQPGILTYRILTDREVRGGQMVRLK